MPYLEKRWAMVKKKDRLRKSRFSLNREKCDDSKERIKSTGQYDSSPICLFYLIVLV
jgi:hypothetical protein